MLNEQVVAVGGMLGRLVGFVVEAAYVAGEGRKLNSLAEKTLEKKS